MEAGLKGKYTNRISPIVHQPYGREVNVVDLAEFAGISLADLRLQHV